MGRAKGGTNRKWTKEERIKYVLMCEEEGYPIKTLARDAGIPYGTLKGWVCRYRKGWVCRYRRGGESALNPDKLRTGNRFSALHASKSLTEEERLRLTVEKLQIENERLKKGYIVKGVGASKEFVTLRDLNSR